MKRIKALANDIQIAEAQHIGYGQQRATLEDRCVTRSLETASGLKLTVGIVADGIGKIGAGEVASHFAIYNILENIQSSYEQQVSTILRHALLSAHQAVSNHIQLNHQPEIKGTSITVAVIHDMRLYIAHVGNTRAYLVRAGKIQQLTLDHTWGNENLLKNTLPPEDVANHSRRDELSRYLGAAFAIEIDIGVRVGSPDPLTSVLYIEGYPLQAGDVIVLSSDGLVRKRRGIGGYYTNPEEIVNLVQRNSPQNAANTLVSLALGRQVDDNVSVVILELPGKKKRPNMVNNTGINTILAVGGTGIVLVFLFMAIIFTQIVLPEIKESRAFTPYPVDMPAGYVIVDSDDGVGQYQAPLQNAQSLESGAIAMQNNTRVMVTSGVVHLQLPNSASIYLNEGTAVIFEKISNEEIRGVEMRLLGQGSAMIQLQRSSLWVQFPNNWAAEINSSMMGVEYFINVFTLDCFEGYCNIFNIDENAGTTLEGPQFVTLNHNSLVENSQTDRVQHWTGILGADTLQELLGNSILLPTASKTPIMQPTQTEISPMLETIFPDEMETLQPDLTSQPELTRQADED